MALSGLKFNLFAEVKPYLRLRKELVSYLSKHPNEWPKFQEIFTLTVDKIYADILELERTNIDKYESDIYRLKKIFEKRYRRYFLYGEYMRWCLNKPFGYSGDFKIIDNIYQNEVRTTGFDGLCDSWFQQLAASKAVRARKEDFKKMILDFAKKFRGQEMRIMNLASGPAREIKELLEIDNNKELFSQTTFDCYDFNVEAINYAKQLLKNPDRIVFFKKNALRLAFKKNIEDEIACKYDLIYSTGLFDYLGERVAIRLVNNLRKILKAGGIMLISNARDKYSNSSSTWMEWIGEWFLIYRNDAEFERIFLNAGFPKKQIQVISQESKVMQYCIVRR